MMNKLGVKTAFFNPDIPEDKFDTYYHFNKESNKPEYFHGVKIYGPAKLKPTDLEVKDLRAGATATIAALVAEGPSTISGIEYIERGYEKLAERLKALGASIDVVRV
jgi:UDP-N-acetylglucosamine enolpyruvyl transferase